MFLELIATFVAGFAAAGVVMTLNWMLGGRLPGWLIPVTAGAAMIAMTIWSEYAWYDRTVANLPEGLEVVDVNSNSSFYRPWTYFKPLKNNFRAVDTATMRSHDANPDLYLTDIYEMERWRAVQKVSMLVDCAEARQGLAPGADAFRPDGTVEGVLWAEVGEDDPLIRSACKGG